ncbi:MAG: glycosyltransferase family 2 protein [Muribaculaceae bacterium]|nr:glycosyltransferase family 2 protein [Muribaculaceae bacterium]
MIPSVSVIIVNYNTAHLIADCVKTILDKTEGIGYEIIVIDNNSEKDFKEIILEKVPDEKKDIFQFISLDENKGFGKANNEGIKIAKGRNILFLNPDTLLVNNAIKILSDFLDSHPKAGACGGNLLDINGTPMYSYNMVLPGPFWELNELLHDIPKNIVFGKKNNIFNNTSQPMKVGYITGADLMVKRMVLDKTGYFRHEFFLYYEETDLCYRIKKAGWDIYSVPQAQIIHLESKSMPENGKWESEFKTKQIEKSRHIYYKLNHGPIKRGISNFLYSLFLLSRWWLISTGPKKNYYKLRYHYFKT